MRIGIETLNGSILFLGRAQLTPNPNDALIGPELDLLLAAKEFDPTLQWRWMSYTGRRTPSGSCTIVGSVLDLECALKLESDRAHAMERIRVVMPTEEPNSYVIEEVAPGEIYIHNTLT